MSNTLTGLVPTLYESLYAVSREGVGFIPSVQRDNGNFSRAAVGQVVSVPIVPQVTAEAIVPGVTAPNDGDQVLTTINMTLSNAYMVPIRWNGEEHGRKSSDISNLDPLRVHFFAGNAATSVSNENNRLTLIDTGLRRLRCASGAQGLG